MLSFYRAIECVSDNFHFGTAVGIPSYAATTNLRQSMLPTVLTSLVFYLLGLLTPLPPLDISPPRDYLQFELRHLHAVSPSSRVVFSNVNPVLWRNVDEDYSVATRQLSTHRPPSFDVFSAARSRSMRLGQSESLSWEQDEVAGPDVETRETLLTLAKMANNAYLQPDESGWYDLEGNWTSVRFLFLESILCF